jgi:hypothetical protein
MFSPLFEGTWRYSKLRFNCAASGFTPIILTQTTKENKTKQTSYLAASQQDKIETNMESKSSVESKSGSCQNGNAESKNSDAAPRADSECKAPDGRSCSKVRSHEDIYDDDEMPDLTDSSDIALMKRASRYCFSHEFIDVFQKYIEKHAEIFYPAVTEEEHRLE